MSSHYFFRSYNNLPNYFGDAYVPPNYAAWQNYTVPFSTPPGWFYSPHYYSPRNTFAEVNNVVCKQTSDSRYCPQVTNVIGVLSNSSNMTHPSMCQLGNRQFTSTQTLAECEFPGSWPPDVMKLQ